MTLIKSFPGKTKNEFLETLKKVYALVPQQCQIVESEEGSLSVDIVIEQSIEVKINLDLLYNDLELKISIFPGINTESSLSFDDLMQRIESLGVATGLDMDRVKEIYRLYSESIIVDSVTVAKGIKPIEGKDAEIVQKALLVEIDDRIDDQGRIDHKKTQTIINVKTGDLLLVKKPATHGVPGMTVTNIVINPVEGKDLDINMLEGVTTDDLGRQFHADIDGHFVRKGMSLAVYPLFKAKEVNYATGNINFNGTVHISGDVLAGFEVTAEKDIIIDGICEDCILKAGNDISIKRGIKGKENNSFHAGGDVTANYMEGANISALGNIYIKQYAFNCVLNSGGDIIATEGKGIIAGGVLKAYSRIEMNQFGADGSQKFNIAVGYKYNHEGEMVKINKELDRMDVTIKQVSHTLSKLNLKNPAIVKNPKVIKMLKLSKELDQKNTKLTRELVELEKQYKCRDPKIRVLKRVESGNSVQFYNYKITVRDQMKDTSFFFDKKNERIGWISLSELESETE